MGSPAFGGSAHTETAEHGGADDHKSPDFKMLSPKQIAEPGGLQGIANCTWGAKVYGNQRELIYMDRQIAIVKNDILDVGLDKTDTIEKTNTIRVKDGRLTEITPTETLNVLGNRFVFVHGQDTEHYLVHREIKEPVERIEHTEKEIEYGDTKAEAVGSSFETTGFAVSVENLKAELEMFVTQNKGISGKLEPLQVHLEAMSTKLGVLTLAAKVKLNALVNWALSSPTS